MKSNYMEDVDSFIAIGDGEEVRVNSIIAVLKESDKSIEYKKVISIGMDQNGRVGYEVFTHQTRTMEQADNPFIFGNPDKCKEYKKAMIDRNNLEKRDIPNVNIPKDLYMNLWNHINNLDPNRKKELRFIGFENMYNGLIIELIEQYLKDTK